MGRGGQTPCHCPAPASRHFPSWAESSQRLKDQRSPGVSVCGGHALSWPGAFGFEEVRQQTGRGGQERVSRSAAGAPALWLPSPAPRRPWPVGRLGAAHPRHMPTPAWSQSFSSPPTVLAYLLPPAPPRFLSLPSPLEAKGWAGPGGLLGRRVQKGRMNCLRKEGRGRAPVQKKGRRT